MNDNQRINIHDLNYVLLEFYSIMFICTAALADETWIRVSLFVLALLMLYRVASQAPSKKE